MTNKKYQRKAKGYRIQDTGKKAGERTARARGQARLGLVGVNRAKAEPKNKDAWPKKELFLFEPKTLFIIIITSVLTLAIAFFGKEGAKFFTSVISPVPEHAPFNGTTFPIQKVPNWVRLTEAERKLSYRALAEEKLLPIPTYNPSRLAIPTETLKWNDPNDDAVRNEKITYTVPYLGTYKLDGLENTGSHPAVDIKVPESTPVYAIANGTVIKAEISNGGFGNYIVLQHNNFPSFDDENRTETLYSSYSHLSSISVKVNDVVVKGQLIGFSGSSGTATTPHLHFQIDRDSAPWHPYWPFSGSEMRSSGYSFFQAINNGLGQNNAIAYTVNPLRYVQKYFGDQALVVSAGPITIPTITLQDPYENMVFLIQLTSAAQFEEGQEISFIIQAFDEKGNLITKPRFKDEVKLSLLNSLGELNNPTLSAFELRIGIVSSVKIKNAKVGKEKLLLRFRNREFSSPEFEILPKKIVIQHFLLVPEKTELKIGENIFVKVSAFDEGINPLPSLSFHTNPTLVLTNTIATLTPSTLEASNFINGETVLTFTAREQGQTEVALTYGGEVFRSPTITVVPAIMPPPLPPPPLATSIITAQDSVETNTEPQSPELPQTRPPEHLVVPELELSVGTTTTPTVQTLPSDAGSSAEQLQFSDIPRESRYYEALKELKLAGLVAGYADSTFKPDKEVSRAEAVTFILRAINEQIRENIKLAFPDVRSEAWYSRFIGTAFELGFVKGHPDGTFKPDSTVNLAEFLTMLFVAAKTDIDPQILINLPQGVSNGDWFAPYLQEAIRKGIVEIENNISQPSQPLTRGEIAEMLWRLRNVEKQSIQ